MAIINVNFLLVKERPFFTFILVLPVCPMFLYFSFYFGTYYIPYLYSTTTSKKEAAPGEEESFQVQKSNNRM